MLIEFGSFALMLMCITLQTPRGIILSLCFFGIKDITSVSEDIITSSTPIGCLPAQASTVKMYDPSITDSITEIGST